MAEQTVTFQVNLEGVEQVTIGFQRCGEAASAMTNKVAASSDTAEMSYRRLMMATAGLISNSIQLGDIMDRMAKGQMDVGRGAVMLSMNFLQLASQLYLLNTAYGGLIASKIISIGLDAKAAAGAAAHTAAEGIRQVAIWGTVIAEKARAIAHAIANALSGPVGWAILAGAAAAAVAGVALASRIPEGAGVYTKASPLRFLTGPLAGTTVNEGASININIYGAGSPQETGDAVVYALRRAGQI